MNKINALFYYCFKYIYYKLIFGKIGYKTRIYKTLRIEKPKNIFIGDKVYIGQFAWLAANPLTNAKNCSLVIGDGSYIGNFAHIYCTSSIVIGKKVLIADKVYISDNLHKYENIEISVLDQEIKQLQPVVIGDGSWLGEHVCIIGATIGKHCVIGANSVVTKNIPDYCIAVGSPAKIIKRFDLMTKKWEKTDYKENS